MSYLLSLFAPSWFYGNIKRPEAEKLLLSPPNEHGAFLIRDNTKDKPSYALSIRDGDVAKHYRIRTTDEGEYFIARHQLLHSLKELVEHYSHNADGLCDMLKKPAVDVSASEFYHVFSNANLLLVFVSVVAVLPSQLACTMPVLSVTTGQFPKS